MRPDLFIRAPAATARRGALLLLALAVAASPARASIFSGDTLDAVADGIAWFVLLVVPLLVIALFWIVHVMPEKIAYKRHHPQAQAIHTLCLLSLVFGGLLWPLAWLWAYSKPVLHKLAYGTDKHDSYYADLAAKEGSESQTLHDDVVRLRTDLDRLVSQGGVPEELASIRDQLAALEPRLASQAGESH